jgi:hypothetical protein
MDVHKSVHMGGKLKKKSHIFDAYIELQYLMSYFYECR